MYCEYMCGVPPMFRHEMAKHVCIIKPKACYMSPFGCGFKAGDFQMKIHVKEAVADHLRLLANDSIEQKENFTETIDLRLVAFTERLMDLEDKIKLLDRQTTSMQNGKLIFCIENWSAYVNKGNRIKCPNFYTRPFGYKCGMDITFSGHDKKNIGVFFFFHKGEYDDILEWPFNECKEIKISVVGKDSGMSNISSSLNPNSRYDMVKKPEEAKNKGYGWESFMDRETSLQFAAPNDCLWFSIYM